MKRHPGAGGGPGRTTPRPVTVSTHRAGRLAGHPAAPGGLRVRLDRRYIIAACAVAAGRGLLAVVRPGPSPLTRPLTTACSPPARCRPPGVTERQIGGWRLASYLVSAAGRRRPFLSPATSPARRRRPATSKQQRVLGHRPGRPRLTSTSRPTVATWSVLPLPAASRSRRPWPARRPRLRGRRALSRPAGLHHTRVRPSGRRPAPVGDGRSSISAARRRRTAKGLGVGAGENHLGRVQRAGGVRRRHRHHRRSGASPPPGSRPATPCRTSAARRGATASRRVYDESGASRSAPLNGFVMISRDGGFSWRWGTLPAGLSPWLFPQVSCLTPADCWMIGYVHDVAYSVMTFSAIHGATWTEQRLPGLARAFEDLSSRFISRELSLERFLSRDYYRDMPSDDARPRPSHPRRPQIRKITDAQTLRALAHPVRIALFEELAMRRRDDRHRGRRADRRVGHHLLVPPAPAGQVRVRGGGGRRHRPVPAVAADVRRHVVQPAAATRRRRSPPTRWSACSASASSTGTRRGGRPRRRTRRMAGGGGRQPVPVLPDAPRSSSSSTARCTSC